VNSEIAVADFTTVARIINLAHRFQCVPTRVESKTDGAVTNAKFEFSGNEKQLSRLQAQIDRIVQFETIFITE
jgi:hypothetical protein